MTLGLSCVQDEGIGPRTTLEVKVALWASTDIFLSFQSVMIKENSGNTFCSRFGVTFYFSIEISAVVPWCFPCM